jgi:hypothetical protein
MPWFATQNYDFNLAAVLYYAPEMSGVYGIHKGSYWIYFGESDSIRRRLSEHVSRPENPIIGLHGPTKFCFELQPAYYRVTCQDQLILEFSPPANRKLG